MIKKAAKRIFSAWGYEIRNKVYKDIFTIRDSMEEAFKQLKNIGFYPELVIDVGAAGGTPPLQDIFGNSIFFWVEPLIEFKDQLEDLKLKFKGDYIIAALGNQQGIMQINVSHDKVGSSILINNIQPGFKSKLREIPIDTLENLAQQKDFTRYKKILLKVDVQGYELHVLEGAGIFLEKIDVIILEVSLYNFLKDCPDFYDVIVYMKKKGFVLYDIVGGINRPKDMALGQKDLLFVKEVGMIRNSHDWE